MSKSSDKVVLVAQLMKQLGVTLEELNAYLQPPVVETPQQPPYAELISAAGFVGGGFAGSREDFSESWSYFLEFLQETPDGKEIINIKNAFALDFNGVKNLKNALKEVLTPFFQGYLEHYNIPCSPEQGKTAYKNAEIFLAFLSKN